MSLARKVLAHRVRSRFPTLTSDPTAIWDYGYADIDAITLGMNVTVRAYAEIIVYRRVRHSSIEGSLTLGDNVTISSSANVRAAGGRIVIGNNSGIAQHTVLLASTHSVTPHAPYRDAPWDESKTGVTIGNNVWIGAHCIVMPGVEIGDNSVIGAGSVVNRSVPANQVWAGYPARLARALEPPSY
jgi:acetyltransferase-like isoleucine patch superfamily enzyme